MQIPPHYTLLYDSQTIAKANAALAYEINNWASVEYSRSAKQILMIAPMRGSLYFAADLSRALDYSAEIRSVSVSSYVTNQNAAALQIEQWKFSLADRLVVIVDEICDSGRTLSQLNTLANSSAAFLVKTVALVVREHAALSFRPDLAGLTFKGSEWLVGYGMDDNDNFRNLPQIYTINAKKC